MNKLLPVIVVLLLLPACSRDKDIKIAELTKKIDQLSKEKEQDIFKKKMECKKYEEDVRKNLSYDQYRMDNLQSVF